ncbi:MAG: DUF721 domain-containing protein [candidate division Zixibacteria bacterium]|nr:DUF721 domain-containing protein [candidate division Zixibacteria bacterium]
MGNMRKRDKNQPVEIGSMVDKIFKSLGLSGNYNGWRVISNWENIVGEVLAKKTKPKKYENGILYVIVEDASWRQNLQMNIGEILGRIHALPYGKVIKKIRLIGY